MTWSPPPGSPLHVMALTDALVAYGVDIDVELREFGRVADEVDWLAVQNPMREDAS